MRKVLSPDSFTGLLRYASDNTSFFVVIGLANAAPIFTLGMLAFFFDKWLMLVGDLLVVAAVICGVRWICSSSVHKFGSITRDDRPRAAIAP